MRLLFLTCLYLTLLQSLIVGKAASAGLSAHTDKILKKTISHILGEVPEIREENILLAPSEKESSVYSTEKQRMLDTISGPAIHDPVKARLGESLGKGELSVTLIPLREVALDAVKGNLDGQMARLLPALRTTDIMKAEGVFDWEAFSSASYGKVSTPSPASAFQGIPITGDATDQTTAELRVGLRKRILTGASIEVFTEHNYLNDSSPGKEFLPNPAFLSDVVLTLTQPLLRNAGSTVNRFQIEFAEKTRDKDRLKMEQTLSEVVLAAEKTYWELDTAIYRVLVSQDLLKRTEETLRKLEARRNIDVKPIQTAQARSFRQSRIQELMQAQAEARNAGDRLKEIINSSQLSLFDENVPIPTNRPEALAEPLTLRSALDTALNKNAELRQAVIELDSSQLEWEVNRIQLQPQLDLKLQGRTDGMGDKFNNPYNDMGNHQGGTVMLELTVPLENRAALSAFERAKLTKFDRELNLQKVAWSVTRTVKELLRKVQLAYNLTRITREGRLAAAENLRTLQEREKDAEPLTPEFLLDLKLATQQRLAEAEIREYQALTDYRIAMAGYLHVSGSLLERHGISAVRESNVMEIK